ncbi:MAG: XrtA-associated ATPase [Betaproteobacteria bacterium]|nr:XrtA-associated ATPase [Betaproteobacteria bacterium]MCL2885705.1 XrtA-associated ATPase [Betaproteobacteria bacterium]
MYEAFYGLSSKPFQLNPDPSFYFGSKQHSRAAAYLDYGMHQNEGFVVITGDVGAGKTTMVRSLLDSLDQKKVIAAHLVSTQLDADDTLRLVGAAFGLRTKDISKADVLMSLEAFLISATSKGKRCLLIVDEAQNLTARAVEELRMLSNFQFGNRALLQSYLIGQPEFRQILQSPHMMQFRQRVIAACHIGPLDAEETRAYIEHRLKCSGFSGSPSISDSAHVAIFKASSGIPRRINSLCDRLLLFGYLSNNKNFEETDVEEVAREIQEETMGGGTKLNLASTPEIEENISPYQGSSLQSFIDSERDKPEALLAGMNLYQFSERLALLEHSLLQLEKINSATLSLLQRLVDDGRRLTRKTHEKDKADV